MYYLIMMSAYQIFQSLLQLFKFYLVKESLIFNLPDFNVIALQLPFQLLQLPSSHRIEHLFVNISLFAVIIVFTSGRLKQPILSCIQNVFTIFVQINYRIQGQNVVLLTIRTLKNVGKLRVEDVVIERRKAFFLSDRNVSKTAGGNF